jgi:hypothetical protein
MKTRGDVDEVPEKGRAQPARQPFAPGGSSATYEKITMYISMLSRQSSVARQAGPTKNFCDFYAIGW